MFQNNRVNLIYRIVCLLTFIAVIIHTKSFVTLAILSLAFYLFTKDRCGYIIGICHTITIIVFLISYFINDYWLLKIVLIFDLIYYFMFITYQEKLIISDSNDNYISSKSLIRFANNRRKDIENNNMLNTMYVTIHLIILFIAILVG